MGSRYLKHFTWSMFACGRRVLCFARESEMLFEYEWDTSNLNRNASVDV